MGSGRQVVKLIKPTARQKYVLAGEPSVFGTWQIVEMDVWDLDAIELVGPARI